MWSTHLTTRLEASGLLPELQHALLCLATYDRAHVADTVWSKVHPVLQQLFGESTAYTEPFTIAWWLMYAASSRLDHLQDDDPVIDPDQDPLRAVNQLNIRYHLVFSSYILAEALLDGLSHDAIPCHRLVQVRRLWNDSMLRMFSGQYRDLITQSDASIPLSLQSYQELAQAKTGAAFALLFGGIAILLTDDIPWIDTLRLVGEIYGLLLQCGDDITDAPTQSDTLLTLPTALSSTYPNHISASTGHTPRAFWPYLYRLYYQQVREIVKDLPSDRQQGIMALFSSTFEAPQDAVETG